MPIYVYRYLKSSQENWYKLSLELIQSRDYQLVQKLTENFLEQEDNLIKVYFQMKTELEVDQLGWVNSSLENILISYHSFADILYIEIYL